MRTALIAPDRAPVGFFTKHGYAATGERRPCRDFRFESEVAFFQCELAPAMSLSVHTDLRGLLRNMAPKLTEGEYVFCTFPTGKIPATLSPICTFQEDEGTSVICLRREADLLGISCEGSYRLITLTVHSSLAAVGFLAAVSAKLTQADIACNAVSAFYHDHLFVPSRDAHRALELIERLSKDGSS